MAEHQDDSPVPEARAAADRGDWGRAHALLEGAEAAGLLSPDDLPFRAQIAYAAGPLEAAIGAWERAHALAMRAGNAPAAAGAAVRVAMHVLFDTGLLGPVRGWLRRAEGLLEGQEETPVHAWLAVARSYERLLAGDFAAAGTWAGTAIAAGGRWDPAAASIGRVAQARTLILTGEVRDGLAQLDEAAVSAVSGELDPLSTGIVYCEVVCALQGLAQYDRAEEWTVAMERWRQGNPVGSLHGRCRVHRAEILRLRGLHGEAEREILRACDELRPYLRREFGWPLVELGRIRLRKGDLDGAERALLAAHEVGWEPEPALALVRLARGETEGAHTSIRRALEHPLNIPSKELPPNTQLRRAPLLEAEVEIAVAAGALEAARRAANELAEIATTYKSRALAAGAAVALGRVGLAAGDPAGARRSLQEAVHLWTEVSAPFETGLARVALAEALRREGNEERARLELRAARSAFDRTGAVREQARATMALGELGEGEPIGEVRPIEPSPARSGAATGGRTALSPCLFRREGDYWSVRFEGETVRLRDLKGLRYLSRLLAAPGREFHVLDLVAEEAGPREEPGPPAGADLRDRSLEGLGPLLDRQARESYRRRLAEIDDDITDARSMGDGERAAQAEAERDFIVRELARAFGLGGRDRPSGSASERARASVTRALRYALARIRDRCPALGEHLDRTIRTGTCCAYRPDPRAPVEWET